MFVIGIIRNVCYSQIYNYFRKTPKIKYEIADSVRGNPVHQRTHHEFTPPSSNFFAILEILRDILANPLTEEGVFYLIMSTAHHDARLHHPQQC